MASYRQVGRLSSNKVFRILLQQGYIGRFYDNSYRLHGKPASYYLTTKGIKLLIDNGIDEKALSPLSRNKTTSSVFVDHLLEVMQVYLNLRAIYPETFTMFARTELGQFDYFPSPNPDIYLQRINSSDETTNDYLLDIFTDPRLFIMRKRIDAYIKHFQEGYWEAATKDKYPAVLLVCPDSTIEKKVIKYAVRALDSVGEADLLFYTTTIQALNSSNDLDKLIWTQVFEDEELVSI
jgi:hypothetical protein